MQDPLREIYELVYEANAAGHPMTAEEAAVWEHGAACAGE